ncbi:MAG: VOC family protein, partial [Gemmatimonadota bacterium]
SVAFYRDTLGLRFLFEVPARMAFFDCDGTWLMLAPPEGDAAAAREASPGSILYFSVDDIERAHGALKGRGVDFVSPPHKVADLGERELWLAFFRDPASNVLALRAEVAGEAT